MLYNNLWDYETIEVGVKNKKEIRQMIIKKEV